MFCWDSVIVNTDKIKSIQFFEPYIVSLYIVLVSQEMNFIMNKYLCLIH